MVWELAVVKNAAAEAPGPRAPRNVANDALAAAEKGAWAGSHDAGRSLVHSSAQFGRGGSARTFRRAGRRRCAAASSLHLPVQESLKPLLLPDELLHL